jgi:enoyl-CoA hydratase
MPVVHSKVSDGIAVVTLDDPDRRNAISDEMAGDIVSTFDWLEHDDDCRAVIVTGNGPAFCAGADLGHLANASQASLRDIYQSFLRIAESPLPTIAAVNGAAVGAGVNMALVCDVILAAESARFDTGFVRLAIHPGGGHTWMLRNQVGPKATAAMVLFSDRIDGATAERIGLAWRCVPDDQLLDAARTMAARAVDAPPELLARIKESIATMGSIDEHEVAVDHELVHQVWSTGQPEFQQRIAALQQQISGNG